MSSWEQGPGRRFRLPTLVVIAVVVAGIAVAAQSTTGQTKRNLMLGGAQESASAPAGPQGPLASQATGRAGSNIQVNCDKGESVSEAIARASSTSVVVDISGTCAEAIVVVRTGVTLSGTLAGGAVIDPPDVNGVASSPGIYAVGAHGLTVRDLTLSGGTSGAHVVGSWSVVLERVTATGNQGTTFFGIEGCAVRADGGTLDILNSDLSTNDCPLVANQHATVTISDSTMHDNFLDGPFAFDHSTLTIAQCAMARNGFGPQAGRLSYTRVVDSTIDASNESFAGDGSQLHYVRSIITNSLADSAERRSHLLFTLSTIQTASLGAFVSSTLTLSGSTVNPNGASAVLSAGNSSQVFAGRTPTSPGVFQNSLINMPVNLNTFSDGNFGQGTLITGSVTCGGLSRALFVVPPVGGTSGC